MSKVEIKTIGTQTHIFVDGQEIRGVRNFSVSQVPGQTPILKLELLSDSMTIDSPMLLGLPEVYKDFYENKSEPLGDGSVKDA